MKKLTSIGLILTLGIILISGHLDAQRHHHLQYTVKYICGKSDGESLAPGQYFTVINIHNPTDTTVFFRKKVAVALPGGVEGSVSPFSKHEIYADGAMEFNCQDIFKQSKDQSGFISGFLVIETSEKLDITAVYTGTGQSGEVEVLDIEAAKPRILKNCPDIVVSRIGRPTWDSDNNRTVIRVTITNIGNKKASKTIARVIDPTTNQPTGAPYNAIAHVSALDPGASETVTFYLPYWVYNPDVILEVTADYKNQLKECDEENNLKVFKGLG